MEWLKQDFGLGRDHAANVKRWRDGQMVLRWVTAGMGEAARQFRRVNGYLYLPAPAPCWDAMWRCDGHPIDGSRRPAQFLCWRCLQAAIAC